MIAGWTHVLRPCPRNCIQDGTQMPTRWLSLAIGSGHGGQAKASNGSGIKIYVRATVLSISALQTLQQISRLHVLVTQDNHWLLPTAGFPDVLLWQQKCK